jgi:Zn-dependent peptidase ImmA (M78 family)
MAEKTLYKLYLAQGRNAPQGSIVGDFKKMDDQNFVCEIILSDDEVMKAGCVDAVTTVFPDKSVIYITADMIDALQEDGQVERFELYHELGHIHCGHYDTGLVDNGSEPDSERLSREEQEADSFAASYLGAEAAESALREMLRVRAQVDKRLGVNGTPVSVKAIRELRVRIENIKNQ